MNRLPKLILCGLLSLIICAQSRATDSATPAQVSADIQSGKNAMMGQSTIVTKTQVTQNATLLTTTLNSMETTLTATVPAGTKVLSTRKIIEYQDATGKAVLSSANYTNAVARTVITLGAN